MRTNLKLRRIEKGYSQKEMASLIGVTLMQYHRVENGNSDGSIKLWEKIKSLLEQPIDFLLENS